MIEWPSFYPSCTAGAYSWRLWMPWSHRTYNADTKEEMCHQEKAYTKEGSSWGSQPIQPSFKYQKQEATPAWIKCGSECYFESSCDEASLSFSMPSTYGLEELLLLLWCFKPRSCNLMHLWFGYLVLMWWKLVLLKYWWNEQVLVAVICSSNFWMKEIVRGSLLLLLL